MPDQLEDAGGRRRDAEEATGGPREYQKRMEIILLYLEMIYAKELVDLHTRPCRRSVCT